MRVALVLTAVAPLFSTFEPAPVADPRAIRLTLSRVTGGIADPTVIAAPNDRSGRIFIGEQTGRIRVWVPGRGTLSTPYLDIRSRVSSGGERGLLGIAFHYQFASNGLFYVAYTDLQGDIRVGRFRASPPANTVSPATEVLFFDIAHRDHSNHNGGQIGFGPDRYFYLGTGDGGGAGDEDGNAQNRGSLLGKILRVDVNYSCVARARYCVPRTNPFVSCSGCRPEIFEYGLRNPWRFSFDRSLGTLWIGDVGQSAREEIDVVNAGVGGVNFGWDCREGTLDTSTTYGGAYCSGPRFWAPLREYSQANGRCAVIGGYMYRGSLYPVLSATYLHADFCTGEIWGLGRVSGSWVNALVYDHSNFIRTFGELPSGELYLADGGGNLYRIGAVRR